MNPRDIIHKPFRVSVGASVTFYHQEFYTHTDDPNWEMIPPGEIVVPLLITTYKRSDETLINVMWKGRIGWTYYYSSTYYGNNDFDRFFSAL